MHWTVKSKRGPGNDIYLSHMLSQNLKHFLCLRLQIWKYIYAYLDIYSIRVYNYKSCTTLKVENVDYIQ